MSSAYTTRQVLRRFQNTKLWTSSGFQSVLRVTKILTVSLHSCHRLLLELSTTYAWPWLSPAVTTLRRIKVQLKLGVQWSTTRHRFLPVLWFGSKELLFSIRADSVQTFFVTFMFVFQLGVEVCDLVVLYQAWMSPSYQLLDPVSCKLEANRDFYKKTLFGKTFAFGDKAQNEVYQVCAPLCFLKNFRVCHGPKKFNIFPPKNVLCTCSRIRAITTC